MNLEDYANLGASYPKVLLYGAPFTGKTTAAASLAERRNIMLIDLDRNAAELVHSVPKQYHSNIDIVPMPDSLENPIYDLLMDFLQGKRVDYNPIAGKKLSIKYRGAIDNVTPKLPEIKPVNDATILVIDSGTTLTESVINYVREVRSRSDKESNLNEIALSERDWELVAGYIARFTKVLKSLPYPVILICHEMLVEMPDKSIRIAPALGSRNTSRNVAKDFTNVVHMSLDGTVFRQSSSQKTNAKVIAGSRRNIFVEKGNKLIDFFNGTSTYVDNTKNVNVTETEKNPLGKPDSSFVK